MEAILAGGRPSKIEHIDKEVFERLISRFNPLDSVSFYLGVSRSSLRSWVKQTYGMTFEEVERIGQAKGRAELLDNAFWMARKNPALLIFLLKNFCGLSDDPRPIDTGEDRREFQSAIKTAAKALGSFDLTPIADIPRGDVDAEE